MAELLRESEPEGVGDTFRDCGFPLLLNKDMMDSGGAPSATLRRRDAIIHHPTDHCREMPISLLPATMSASPDPAFLDTVEGEMHLFRAVAEARPAGVAAHFNILQIWLELNREMSKHVQV